MLPTPRAELAIQTPDFENYPLVKANGFREYDARWLFGAEINLLGVEALGLGLGTYIQELGQKRTDLQRSFNQTARRAMELKEHGNKLLAGAGGGRST
jgi:phosphomannomutase/phosphoglucomutase